MEARELPPDEVLASWHVEQRALDLRAAGMSGTLADLRVRAYLDSLQERDSRLVPAEKGTDEAGCPTGPGGDSPRNQDSGPAGPPDPGDSPGGADGPGSRPGGGPGGTVPGGTGAGGRPHEARQGDGPSVAALVNILVPVETLLGLSTTRGRQPGTGCWTPKTPGTWWLRPPGTRTPGGA